MLLKDRVTNNPLCVVNTHLYWGSPDMEKNFQIQIIQADLLLLELENFISQNGKCAIVLCGDFNSEAPNGGAFALVESGKLSNTHPQLTRQGKTAPAEIELDHPTLNLKNAYKLGNYSLPYTTVTGGFTGWIDHIFISPGTLDVAALLKLQHHKTYTKNVALPSVAFGSDHILTLADVAFT